MNVLHPLGGHEQPGDVVEASLFPAGEKVGWITGTALLVDGWVVAGRGSSAA